MKITVEFDTEEEFKQRIKNPRGSRGGNDDGETTSAVHQAPAPIAPPQQQSPATFQPGVAGQTGGFTPPTAFPSGPAVDPAVQALVTRINTRIDGAIASGQPADSVLNWFRGQCGPEAANATMDQIKSVFLPKAPLPTLENIAKLMNA